MTVFADIQGALNTHALLLSLPTAWENDDFTPTNDALYIAPFILPADTEQAGLGAQGLDDNSGIYQINIVAPADGGNGVALIKADVVADHFARGQTLTYNGVNVRLGNVSRGQGGRDGAWFIIPVFINYQSFTVPR